MVLLPLINDMQIKLQWDLQTRDTMGPTILYFVEGSSLSPRSNNTLSSYLAWGERSSDDVRVHKTAAKLIVKWLPLVIGILVLKYIPLKRKGCPTDTCVILRSHLYQHSWCKNRRDSYEAWVPIPTQLTKTFLLSYIQTTLYFRYLITKCRMIFNHKRCCGSRVWSTML